MDKKNTLVYLEDVLESANLISDYLSGVSEQEFYKDIGVQDKVIRRLEIIGEAVKQISEEIKSKYPDIPWRKIAGMRDVLIHEYSGVKIRRVWLAVNKDLPQLRERISKIIEGLNPLV